jgi:hypothetical protein
MELLEIGVWETLVTSGCGRERQRAVTRYRRPSIRLSLVPVLSDSVVKVATLKINIPATNT